MKKNKNKGSQQGGFFSSTGLSLNKTPVNPPERERESWSSFAAVLTKCFLISDICTEV